MQFQVKPARDQRFRAWMGFQALGEAGENAIPELGRLLVTDGKPEFVAEALSAISAKAVPVLLDALPRVEGERQYAIVEAALRWPSEQPAVVEALRRLLSAPSREARICAARCLGGCRRAHERSVQALVSALEDSEFAVRWQAVASLTELGTNAIAAVPALEKLSRESAPAFALSNALFRIQSPLK